MVNPSDFSLPMSTRINIKQLFPGNNFISRKELNSLVGKQVDWLNYASLKNVAMTNLGPNYRLYFTETEANHTPHFRTTLRELYLRESKGSKIFSGVFNYDLPMGSINTHQKKMGTTTTRI